MAGETTTVAASAARNFYDNPGAGAFVVSFNLTYLSTDNETADIMQAGYLPPNVKMLAVGWYPTDMDTGSAAVVHKVTVGSTDIVTGLTGAQTGTSSFTPVTNAARVLAPATTPTLVVVNTTTAAATGAAGTAVLDIWCQKV